MTIPNMNHKMQELTYARLEEVGRTLCADKEYLDYTDLIRKLYKNIEALLPEEGRKLLSELDEEMTSQSNLYLEKIYKQGLKDGLELISSIN